MNITDNKKSPAARRGRPKKSLTKSLRRMRKADWERLTSATILALFNKEYSLYLRVSYLLKLPEDFPTFKLIEKDGLENIIKFRTKSLMRYLIATGRTTCDMYQLQQAQRSFTMEQNALDNLFNEAYNCTFGDEPCKIINEQLLGENDEQQLD